MIGGKHFRDTHSHRGLYQSNYDYHSTTGELFTNQPIHTYLPTYCTYLPGVSTYPQPLSCPTAKLAVSRRRRPGPKKQKRDKRRTVCPRALGKTKTPVSGNSGGGRGPRTHFYTTYLSPLRRNHPNTNKEILRLFGSVVGEKLSGILFQNRSERGRLARIGTRGNRNALPLCHCDYDYVCSLIPKISEVKRC